jgi:hypothetical protein
MTARAAATVAVAAATATAPLAGRAALLVREARAPGP